MSGGDRQYRRVRSLVRGLVEAGVRDVVVSPGGRSTPIVLALAERAELRLHAVADERSAGFFALGVTRASARPTALVCTSGSAPAHYYPAVLEAEAAALPLVVLSADRPAERLGRPAPQTLDQRHLFGRHVRGFLETTPDDLDGEESLATRAAELVRTATSSPPGPVHLDVRLRRPLEPERWPWPDEEDDQPPGCSSRIEHREALDEAKVRSVVESLAAARRPLLMAGPAEIPRAPAPETWRSLVSLGLPAGAEWGSQLRAATPAELALPRLSTMLEAGLWADSSTGLPAPDVVLQIGLPLTATVWERRARALAARGSTHLVVAGPGDPPDPMGTASSILQGEVDDLLRRLSAGLEDASPRWDRGWIEELAERHRRAEAVRALLAGQQDFAAAVEALTAAGGGAALFGIGNSLPLREAEEWAAPSAAPADAVGGVVWTQRGLNGIDGLVSGFAGTLEGLGRSSASASGLRALLWIGDVSLLHDLAGVGLLARRSEASVLLVVCNNGGGRIFDRLPLGDLHLPPEVGELWSTPHCPPLDRVADLFDLRYHRAGNAAELGTALEALGEPGVQLVEWQVEPRAPLDAHRRLLREVAEALALPAVAGG